MRNSRAQIDTWLARACHICIATGLFWLCAFSLAALLIGCAACQTKAGVHPNSRNWKPLFAPDLSDATFRSGAWLFTNGVLTAIEDTCIWTKTQYENFTLDLEFKLGEAANSGVIVYCSDTANWIPNSVEIQILDDDAPKWAKTPPTWKCGGLFGHSAPKTKAVHKPGVWNRMTVGCSGPQIRVWLNGKLVTDANIKEWTSATKNPDGSEIPPWLTRPLAELPTKGYVGLQGKHGEAPIYFRNLRIKLHN